MPHLVTAKLLGQHSYTIEERSFEFAVALWLQEIFPRPEEKYQYHLYVEARRMKGSSYTPEVEAFCFSEFLAASIELRAKPRDNPYRWKCFLHCPSVAIAQGILRSAKPEMVDWLERQNERYAQEEAQDTSSKNKRIQHQAWLKRWNEVADDLTDFFGRRLIALELYEDMKAQGQEDVITLEMVRQTISRRTTSGNVSRANVLRFFVPRLVARGMLLPDSKDEERYGPTEILLEFASSQYQHRAYSRLRALEEDGRRLETQIKSTQDDLEAAETSVRTAANKLNDLQAQLVTKQGEIAEAGKQVSLFGEDLNGEPDEPA